jgi:hypothetical protein
VNEVGSVTLSRRTYVVFEDGPDYVVRSEGQRGQIFERRIPARLVEEVGEALSGREVRKEDAAREAARFGDPDQIPAGYQRAYFGQDVLVVLTALGQADARQEGRAWIYTL